MTIKRKPTDDTTPEMTFGALTTTALLTIWDATTKVGHRMQLSTLRAWLIARLMPPGTAGRVVVTDGTGGIAAGPLLEDVGGGGGGGGPITLRQLAPESFEGGLLFRALVADLEQGVYVPPSVDQKALALPRGSQTPIGSRLVVQYGGNFASPLGELYLGAQTPDEDGGSSIVLRDDGPVVVPAGTVVEIIKTAELDFGGGEIGHLWALVDLPVEDEGGGGLQPMDPAPAEDNVLVADGAGGLKDGGPMPTVPPPAAVLFALKPAADAVGNYDYHAGSADGFVASVTLRLNGTPAGEETVAGNFAAGTASGGWGLGVNATGFTFAAARASDGALQTLAQAGLASFANYTAAELLTRTFVLTMVVAGAEMRCFVGDFFVGAVALLDGYKPATTPDSRLSIHLNSSGGSPRHASASEFCALYYVDPTIYDPGGYTDAHARALFRGAFNNAGVYTGIDDNGDVFAVNAMTDGDPYSYMYDTCGTPSASALFVLGAAPHRGREAMARW